VGKVLHIDHSVSLVLLINDQTSGVGAILEKSRLQGILRGMPSGEIALEKVMSDEQVPVGELVLSSGGDRVFPKGLAIGRVSRVSPGSDNFLNIQVKPTANLSKLEEVLIVTKIDERQATPEQAGPVRAADVLAERLPSVPPKPAEASGTAVAGSAPPPGVVVEGKPAQSKLAPPKPSQPKPKASALAGDASSAPAVRKPITSAPSTSTAEPADAGTGAAKVTQKPAKPATETEPHPPAQEPPQ
jgi:rod shape-determining protein MreC